jgi:hypothetical protein
MSQQELIKEKQVLSSSEAKGLKKRGARRRAHTKSEPDEHFSLSLPLNEVKGKKSIVKRNNWKKRKDDIGDDSEEFIEYVNERIQQAIKARKSSEKFYCLEELQQEFSRIQ